MGSALDRLRQLEEQQRVATAPPAEPGRRRGGFIAVALAVLGVLLLKGKWVLLFLLTKAKLVFGALKLGPLLATGQTMLIAAWAYALYFGWSFAIGLVLLVLVHEIGHALAAGRVGIRVGAPMFIPFFGAVIALRDRPRSTSDEAVIAAGGPIVGGLAAAGCVAVAPFVPGDLGGLLAVIGFYGLMLNLFNLTPVWTLDGARMLAPVGVAVQLAGAGLALAVLVAAAMVSGGVDPVSLIAVAACLVTAIVRAVRARRRPRTAPTILDRVRELDAAQVAIPDDVSPALRTRGALIYFGTLIALIVAVHALRASLPTLS